MSIYKIRTEFGQHLKWLMAIVAAIFVVGAVFTFGPGTGGGGDQPGSKDVIATVNGVEITRAEMDALWQQTLENVRNQPGMRSSLMLARVRAQVFQSLLNTRITDLTASKLGVTISERDVKAKRDDLLVDQLKERRRMVLGKLTAEQEKIDPRNDDDFKAELAKIKGPSGIPMTISQIQQDMERFVSEAQIRQVLAMEGIQNALKAKAGNVTPRDINNSFNAYKMRVIMFTKDMPKEQLATQVNKVADEAKKGADFVSLAKKYSKDPSKGEIQTVQFGMVSPGVWNTVTNIKVGQVSNPIDSGDAIYIVKMEGVENKKPAKFDKKAQEERKAMIENSRMSQEYMKFQEQVRNELKIKVDDTELKGYYLLSEVQQASSPTESMKRMRLAQKAFEDAVAKQPNNQYAQAMLADLLKMQGNDTKATQVLYQLLEGKGSSGSGVDLRIMLGDLLAKNGKKDDAIAQYMKASADANVDVDAHRNLAVKFKAVGKADLAAKETALADDYEKKLKLMQERQNQNAPAPKPGQ